MLTHLLMQSAAESGPTLNDVVWAMLGMLLLVLILNWLWGK